MLGNKNVTPVSPDVVAAIVAEAERKLKMATPVESADSTQVSGSFCHVLKQYCKVPKDFLTNLG